MELPEDNADETETRQSIS